MPVFTPRQLAAIDIDRLGQDACIVAGPGSGKTTVLVERYRQLIELGVRAGRAFPPPFRRIAFSRLHLCFFVGQDGRGAPNKR